MAALEVRIRLHQLTLDWLEAVAVLLQEIDQADPVLVTDEIKASAANVRDVMFASAADHA
jgi:hypothetical protein